MSEQTKPGAKAEKPKRPSRRLGLGLGALAAVLLIAVIWLQIDTTSPRDQGASPTLDPARRAPSAVPTLLVAQTRPTSAPSATAVLVQLQLTSPPVGTLASDPVQRIDPLEAKALMDTGKAVLYDVRPLDSYQIKHAVGALSLPEDQIGRSLDSLPKGKALILYCT